MHSWQIQDAKARLSEVIRGAEQDGPQEITYHGRSVAVLLSRAEYDRLAGTGSSLAASQSPSGAALTAFTIFSASSGAFSCNNFANASAVIFGDADPVGRRT